MNKQSSDVVVLGNGTVTGSVTAESAVSDSVLPSRESAKQSEQNRRRADASAKQAKEQAQERAREVQDAQSNGQLAVVPQARVTVYRGLDGDLSAMAEMRRYLSDNGVGMVSTAKLVSRNWLVDNGERFSLMLFSTRENYVNGKGKSGTRVRYTLILQNARQERMILSKGDTRGDMLASVVQELILRDYDAPSDDDFDGDGVYGMMPHRITQVAVGIVKRTLSVKEGWSVKQGRNVMIK